MSTAIMPRPGLLNREQCGRLMSETRVRIVEPLDSLSGHAGEYWRDNFDGYTPNIHEAGVYTAARAISGTFGTEYLFELVQLEPPPPVDPTKPIPIRLTFRQLSQNMAGIEAKMCRQVCDGKYIKKPYPNGYTTDVEQAHVCNVKNALESSSDCSYELLDREEALRISQLPVKMCIITEALSSALIDSLKLHPNHPVYRALVLSTLGKMPPPELTTFDEVVHWIEFNCEARNKVRNEPGRAAPAPANTLEIRLSFSDTEVGTCHYTVDRYGSGTYRFTAADLEDMAEDVENIDELVESIEVSISDRARDVQGDMEQSDDGPDFNNYNSTDTENEQWEYCDSQNERRARLIAFLQRNLSVEQRERLGITAP